MAIKVIVELRAKPGKRAELNNLLESVAERLGPGASGYLGSVCYEVLDNPDILVRSPIGRHPIWSWHSASKCQHSPANRLFKI